VDLVANVGQKEAGYSKGSPRVLHHTMLAPSAKESGPSADANLRPPVKRKYLQPPMREPNFKKVAIEPLVEDGVVGAKPDSSSRGSDAESFFDDPLVCRDIVDKCVEGSKHNQSINHKELYMTRTAACAVLAADWASEPNKFGERASPSTSKRFPPYSSGKEDHGTIVSVSNKWLLENALMVEAPKTMSNSLYEISAGVFYDACMWIRSFPDEVEERFPNMLETILHAPPGFVGVYVDAFTKETAFKDFVYAWDGTEAYYTGTEALVNDVGSPSHLVEEALQKNSHLVAHTFSSKRMGSQLVSEKPKQNKPSVGPISSFVAPRPLPVDLVANVGANKEAGRFERIRTCITSEPNFKKVATEPLVEDGVVGAKPDSSSRGSDAESFFDDPLVCRDIVDKWAPSATMQRFSLMSNDEFVAEYEKWMF
ncbi:hypothetical protein Tco_1103837, partial [Tanacetum coccineum]